MGIIEKAGPYFDMKLDNLAEVCSREPKIMDCVAETAIVYEMDMYVDPAIRLAIAVSTLIMQVDAHNKNRQIQPPNTEDPREDMNKNISKKKNPKDIKQNGSNEQENRPAST